VGTENDQIGIKTTTTQGREGRHADAKGIAASKTNALPTDIQAEDRTGSRPH
jgi:hypothetical protein